MSAFIEEHRERFGVEPVCSTLGVSASAYYERASGPRSVRVVEDERLLAKIEMSHPGFSGDFLRRLSAEGGVSENVESKEVPRGVA